MSQESPLFVKTYDLLVYLMAVSEKFPRSHRTILGRRIQEFSLEFLDLLLAARKCASAERLPLLKQSDLKLDQLRYTVRICHGLDLLSQKQYCRAAGLLGEVGCLLGAWIKRYNTA